MRICPISINTSHQKNFKGEFVSVVKDVELDNINNKMKVSIHSIYYPDKNETEQEIYNNMKKYTRTEKGSANNWDYLKTYTCHRGETTPE